MTMTMHSYQADRSHHGAHRPATLTPRVRGHTMMWRALLVFTSTACTLNLSSRQRSALLLTFRSS